MTCGERERAREDDIMTLTRPFSRLLLLLLRVCVEPITYKLSLSLSVSYEQKTDIQNPDDCRRMMMMLTASRSQERKERTLEN